MNTNQYYSLIQKEFERQAAEIDESHQKIQESRIFCQEKSLQLLQHPSEFYFCINELEYKKRVISALRLQRDDVVLDIGTGYADLPLMIYNKVKLVYAVELHKEIYDFANQYISKYPRIRYYNLAFQEFDFPRNITKCVFLAWHCSRLTEQQVFDKLEKTECKLFINNFGENESINILRLRG